MKTNLKISEEKDYSMKNGVWIMDSLFRENKGKISFPETRQKKFQMSQRFVQKEAKY